MNAVTSLISPRSNPRSIEFEPLRRRPTQHLPNPNIIGCKHAECNRKGPNIRIKWSKEELSFIKKWLTKFEEAYTPEDRAKLNQVSL